MKNSILLLLINVLFWSCGTDEQEFDATGTFEADEVIISSEASGKVLSFEIEEGQILSVNQQIGYVDTTQLFLSRRQLEAQVQAVLSRKPDVAPQLAALRQQLKAATNEQARVQNLLQSDAATPKQLDDLNAEIEITKGHITALKNSLNNSIKSLDSEIGPLQTQILQVDDLINKSLIVNPLSGTVLSKYAEAHEQVSNGQPLYRIADLSEITLKAYVTGDQFAKVRLNQQVNVFTDDGDGDFKETKGTIYWISEKAEFTPKSIQTRNERANKVYAIKIKVVNDGSYKIGMYGEVTFGQEI
ncbi:MAG: HlyD family efflux transporter periplasmic adaptor subunit [Bacteroidota bacterium]